jgi:septal ring factor EnvC (AmiA/AmiB activator)
MMSINFRLLACCSLLTLATSSAAFAEEELKCSQNALNRHNANIEKKEAFCTGAQAKVKEIQAAIAELAEATPAPDAKGKAKKPNKSLANKLKAAQKSANVKCGNVQKAIDALKKYEKKHCPTPTPTPTATPTAEPTATPGT